jgi:hypothetical protein
MYVCGVDWLYEIGEAADIEGKMPFYSSLEELKADRSCWDSCGIVEIQVDFSRWIEPQKLFSDEK